MVRTAKTPLDRLIEYHNKNNAPISLDVLKLIKLREQTDPFRLSKDITKLIKQIKEHKDGKTNKKSKVV